MTEEAEHAPVTAAMPALRLRRLKINRWRNVLPGTELRFGEGIHALLGKNGTGKTTLLRLISMCVRRDFSALQPPNFDIEYELEFGHERVVVSLAHQESDATQSEGFPPEFSSPLHVVSPQSKYHFSVQAYGGAGRRAVVEVTQEKMLVNGTQVPREVTFNPLLPGALVVSMVAIAANGDAGASPPSGGGTTQVPITLSNFSSGVEPCRFDESDGMLRVLEGASGSEATSALDMTPFRISLIREPFRLAGGQWVPAEVVPALVSAIPQGHLPLNEIVLTQEVFHVLKQFGQLTGLRVTEMSVGFQSRTKRSKLDVSYYADARFRVELPGGDMITQKELSFGQRRLLGFLYYCACNPSTLIVDELTNGLHHEWIAHCMDELAKRQSFVATQHPLLLDYLPIESAKDAETAFLQCRLVEQDGKQYMTWRNTSPEEAERFWKSYGSGVQFISEILRTDGLW